MTKTSMMKKLTKIAVELDVEGYEKEAQTVAQVMNKIANVFDDDFNRMAEEDMYDEPTPGRSEMFESDLPGELDIEPLNMKDSSVKAIMNSIADKITMAMPELSDREILEIAMDMTRDTVDRINRLSSDRNM